MRSIFVTFPFLILILLQPPDAKAQSTLQEGICKLTGKTLRWPLNAGSFIDRSLAQFYQLRRCKPLFYRNGRLTYKARRVATLLGRAYEDGLSPELYRYSSIYSRINEPFLGEKGQLEILLAKGLVEHIIDLQMGVSRRLKLKQGLFPRIRHILAQALRTPDLLRYAHRHAPHHRFYSRLKRAYIKLWQMRQQQVDHRPVTLDPTKRLKAGNRGEHVRLLQSILRSRGDYNGPLTGKFDQALTQALTSFQKRHGLEPDGRLGLKTATWLNRTPRQLMEIVAVNMERWRRLGGDPGGDDIIVNLAGFELQVYKGRRPVTSMKVVVGRHHTKTPVIETVIRDLVINPYWNIPPAIVSSSILPKILADPQYLQKSGITVYEDWEKDNPIFLQKSDWLRWARNMSGFPHRLTMKPGPDNPLGRIKFELQGTDSIYFHDTPHKHLFQARKRDFSFGCIRLEDPVRLATILLNQGHKGKSPWNGRRLLNLISGEETIKMELNQAYPVYLTYQTAWAQEDGRLFFADDIYERDAAIARVLGGQAMMEIEQVH